MSHLELGLSAISQGSLGWGRREGQEPGRYDIRKGVQVVVQNLNLSDS